MHHLTSIANLLFRNLHSGKRLSAYKAPPSCASFDHSLYTTSSMGNTIIKESPAHSTTLSSLNKLTTLSKNIEEKTKILTEELRSKGLEAPSFSPTGPADFPLSEVSLEVLQARDDVIAQAKDLHDILLSPRVSLKTFAWDVSRTTPPTATPG